MLDKGAIHATKPSNPQFIGHIFLRPKKDGGMRPVFNMKALNQFIQYKHFKMENLAMLKTLLQKQDYMIKVDLKDAYFCIPICRKDQQYLRFQWRNKLYQFSCLPFGLTSAPRQFTKLMKPIVSLLRRIGIRLLIYLDDLLILNQNKVQLAKDANSLIFLLQNLGLVINWGKSVLEPTQELEYLGMLINSNTMELSLPQTKLHDIQSRCKQMLAQDTTTVHKLAQLIGTLTATMQAIHPGPLYYREMQMLKTKQLLHSQTYSAKITLTPKCREELRWWLLHMETWNGKAIMSPGPDMIIQTDASLKGWGAYLEGRPASSGDKWPLVGDRDQTANKLPRTEGSGAGGAIICEEQGVHPRSSENGQHYSPNAYQQDGGHQITITNTNDEIPLGILLDEEDTPHSRISPGKQEQDSRCPVTTIRRLEQLETRSATVHGTQQSVGTTGNGFVCRQTECPDHKILQLETRPAGSRYRRFPLAGGTRGAMHFLRSA